MGKRKSRTSKLMAEPKKAPKLDTEFACPFCDSPRAVQCRVVLKARTPYGVASCVACKEVFVTGAHALTEPIDVYTDWIDACEEANRGVDVRRRRRRLGDATDD